MLEDDDASPMQQDPWLDGRDPWSQARPSLPEPAVCVESKPGVGATKLAEIEAALRSDMQELQQKVAGSSSASASSGSADESRLKALEVGLTEMRHQNTKFESWFQAFGTKVNDQTTALVDLQAPVRDQQSELAQCRVDMQSTVSSAVGAL